MTHRPTNHCLHCILPPYVVEQARFALAKAHGLAGNLAEQGELLRASIAALGDGGPRELQLREEIEAYQRELAEDRAVPGDKTPP